MVALNFMKQFAPAVEEGRKRQSIRARRKKGGAFPGCSLQLYTAMRTKHCRKLGDAICDDVLPIEISEGGIKLSADFFPADHAFSAELARLDGFDGFDAFKEFFKKAHGLPFSGDLIRW